MSKSVLITGASSGIGEALAKEFARRGYRLALLARRVDSLRAMEAALTAAGSPQVVSMALDVSRFADIAPAIESCATQLGGLDIVIANAGIGPATPAGKAELSAVRDTIDVNLTGAILTLEAAVRLFRARGHGRAVAITSVARYRGLPGFGVYSAVKEGLHRYMQSLRIETLHEPITVTELAPGYIDTPLNRGNPSRPFLIDVEQGARDMADKIERGVSYATVPTLPWVLIGRLLQLLPDRMLHRLR